jgi:hypothetical protein
LAINAISGLRCERPEHRGLQRRVSGLVDARGAATINSLAP